MKLDSEVMLRGTAASRPADCEMGRGDKLPPIEPMTWSLLGRFFGVPLLIISTIVGGAIIVVLLFGGPAAPQQRSINELLTALEASTGERSAGILLPREKELWQMALELSTRLEKGDSELTGDELATAAERIAAMVEADLAHPDQIAAPPEDVQSQRDLRSRRFEFLVRALGRTGRWEAVQPLIDIVNAHREPYVAAAVQELGNLRELPEARLAVAPMIRLLHDSQRTETLMVASTALSVLADRGDEGVVGALKAVLFSHEGEVAWSAALALARLGDASGRSVLLDMLDRTYWEKGDRFQTVRPRIDAMLRATIDAAAQLDDRGLWEAIDRLKSDSSPSVRAKADEARRRRTVPTDSDG
ncbi:MAG: hypothetical protein Q7R41_00620 [Phycisphaerales bacterium]|nr:hypothetical protein [Phycisphaerales bacterium]